jgi:hypothetical protein
MLDLRLRRVLDDEMRSLSVAGSEGHAHLKSLIAQRGYFIPALSELQIILASCS